MVPLLKLNNRKKVTLIAKGSLRNLGVGDFGIEPYTANPLGLKPQHPLRSQSVNS